MMKKYSYKVGDTIWQGCRYWKQDDLGPNEVSGWNVDYEPYQIRRITPKRLVIWIPRSEYPEIHLSREKMESTGIQYHSRVAEYFFARKPYIVGDYVGKSTDEIQRSFDQAGK